MLAEPRRLGLELLLESRVTTHRSWARASAVSAILGVVAYSCVSQRQHERDMQGLRAEMEELRRLREETVRSSPASPPTSPPRDRQLPEALARADAASGGTPEETPTATPEERREFFRTRDAEHLLRYESTFDSELNDRGWSATAESQISAVARNALSAGAVLEEVRCRSTLCRMTTAHPDSSAASNFFLSYIGPDAGWKGGIRNFSSTDSTGRVRIKSFLVREGSAMPR